MSGARAARWVGPALAVALLAGCGGSTRRVAPPVATGADPLRALAAAAPPAGWTRERIASGAVMFYPPGWHPVHGDGGTATAVTTDAHGRIAGYLNLTPRQGDETAAGWARFRVHHNAEEGERAERAEGARASVPFRGGTGTCVRDSYRTSTGSRYVELACLVAGAHGSSVIVAAASPQQWTALSPTLVRAVSALIT